MMPGHACPSQSERQHAGPAWLEVTLSADSRLRSGSVSTFNLVSHEGVIAGEGEA